MNIRKATAQVSSAGGVNESLRGIQFADSVYVRRFLLGLGIYFSAHVFVRILASNSLASDEAQQVYLSQWLLSGYSYQAGQSPQPPLYQWIQIGFFQIFGLNVPALAIPKNLILFLTYVLAFLAAHALTGDIRLSILASLSLFLIPQIAWESHRDLTHSVLATMMSVGMLNAAVRLVRTPSLIRSLLFGGFVGLGIMSKYNVVLFACALVLAMATTRETRGAILSRYGAFSLAGCVLINLTHIEWWLSHADLPSAAVTIMHRSEIWSPIR